MNVAARFSAACVTRTMIPVTGSWHKNIRLRPPRYRGKQSYFITLCFDGRRRFGANSRVAKWLVGRIQETADRFEFMIHAFGIMPDHVHILACGMKESSDLMVFVEMLKQETGFEFERRTDRRLWQKKYYDHILRSGDSMDRVAWYIWMNPVRKRLCDTPSTYPFAGSFTVIGKKLLAGYRPIEWIPPWRKTRSVTCA